MVGQAENIVDPSRQCLEQGKESLSSDSSATNLYFSALLNLSFPWWGKRQEIGKSVKKTEQSQRGERQGGREREEGWQKGRNEIQGRENRMHTVSILETK